MHAMYSCLQHSIKENPRVCDYMKIGFCKDITWVKNNNNNTKKHQVLIHDCIYKHFPTFVVIQNFTMPHCSLSKWLDYFLRHLTFHGIHQSIFSSVFQTFQLCFLQTFYLHWEICHNEIISWKHHYMNYTGFLHSIWMAFTALFLVCWVIILFNLSLFWDQLSRVYSYVSMGTSIYRTIHAWLFSYNMNSLPTVQI